MSRILSPAAERYLDRGLRRVNGWLLPGAAKLILETAKMQTEMGISGNVAEIGVHEGRLFILLCLLRNDGEEAVAVDVFDRQDLNRDRSGHGDKGRLETNLQEFVRCGKPPLLMRADSLTINSRRLIEAVGGPFRIFSIDGGHEAQTVCHDLETASGALCDGGIIVLDDYFNEGWPGVADGTNQFFNTGKSRDLVPFAIAQNKVCISRDQYSEKYRQGLTRAFADRSKVREATLFGRPVSYFNFNLNRAGLFLMHASPGVLRFVGRACRLIRVQF